MPYFIKVPTPIQLVNVATKKPLDGKPWGLPELNERLMLNPLWGETYPAMRSAKEIEEAVAAPVSGYVKLSDEAYGRYKQAAEKPVVSGFTESGQGFQAPGLGLQPPTLAIQVIPLIAAIMDATSVEPDELKAKP